VLNGKELDMLIPKPLAADSHIRIISPGMPTIALVPDRTRRAERALRNLGFEISYGAHALSVSDDGTTAGAAADRAADVMEAFGDESVDAILASDSGLGSRELLPLLDAAVIAANPKPFIGFCDTNFLHQYLASYAGISSLYGCIFTLHFGEVGGPYPETLEYFKSALMSPEQLICRPLPSRTADVIDWFDPESEGQLRGRDIPGGWTWVRPGCARGQLLGGEISTIPAIVNCFDLRLDGTVLFWHVAIHNEQPLRTQLEALSACADLSNLAGMIVGAHPRLAPDQWAQVVDSMMQELLPGTSFPILTNADLGHLCPSWIVPYGEDVVLDDSKGIIFPRAT
jgi:muramoyltetrapeptide carboxypeptidase